MAVLVMGILIRNTVWTQELNQYAHDKNGHRKMKQPGSSVNSVVSHVRITSLS
jgi:hypothetical protein